MKPPSKKGKKLTTTSPYKHFVYSCVKTAFDYSLTIPGLILISPLFMQIAIMVKIDSPGPIFEKQKVMGLNGREFYMIKYRTTYTNKDQILDKYPLLESDLEKAYTLKADPRITRLGRILRKFSLDKLPLLFNVLTRDMSLVGPQYVTSKELTTFYGEWGEELLTTWPGLTGLWQVSGRNTTTYEERIHLDMHYIENWSIWLDIKILLQTIPAIIQDGRDP